MNFMDRDGWHISFLESDCKTSLPLKLTFAKEDKIRDIFERHGADDSLDTIARTGGSLRGRNAALETAPRRYSVRSPLVLNSPKTTLPGGQGHLHQNR
jgi:hypothetical protein